MTPLAKSNSKVHGLKPTIEIFSKIKSCTFDNIHLNIMSCVGYGPSTDNSLNPYNVAYGTQLRSTLVH